MKIGFLLNHYDLHQVPHVVPYAFELSRQYQDSDVVIFGSTQGELDFAQDIGSGYRNHRCVFEKLQVPFFLEVIDPLLSKWIFLRKPVALRVNADRLSQFDALVAPEMTTLQLRKLQGFTQVKFIRVVHGAGDNRLGGGSFDPRIGHFDLTLLPGRKYVEGLKEAGHLPHDRWAISGYPKFEAIDGLGIQKRKLFDNDKLTVLYNPHHAPHLSSWEKMGRNVLDLFYGHKQYNLIFAPHVLLFRRSWKKGSHFPKKYKSDNGVLIDLSSRASVDMTYLKAADIYLGDVSSQVYEFLAEPRPCVFLNTHEVNQHENPSYYHWNFGSVIDQVSQLEETLEKAFDSHAQYEDVQRRAFAYTFEFGNTSVAERGAHIIAEYLKTGQVDVKWQ